MLFHLVDIFIKSVTKNFQPNSKSTDSKKGRFFRAKTLSLQLEFEADGMNHRFLKTAEMWNIMSSNNITTL